MPTVAVETEMEAIPAAFEIIVCDGPGTPFTLGIYVN